MAEDERMWRTRLDVVSNQTILHKGYIVLCLLKQEQENADCTLTSLWYRRRSWKKAASFPITHTTMTATTAIARLWPLSELMMQCEVRNTRWRIGNGKGEERTCLHSFCGTQLHVGQPALLWSVAAHHERLMNAPFCVAVLNFCLIR